MDRFRACAIALAVVEAEDSNEFEVAFQYLIDTGEVWTMPAVTQMMAFAMVKTGLVRNPVARI